MTRTDGPRGVVGCREHLKELGLLRQVHRHDGREDQVGLGRSGLLDDAAGELTVEGAERWGAVVEDVEQQLDRVVVVENVKPDALDVPDRVAAAISVVVGQR